MLRLGLLVAAFAVGLAAAVLWKAQVHHLRAVLPGALPAWTAALPGDATLMSGRADLPAGGLRPALTVAWQARAPGTDGLRWKVRATGPGLDVTGDLAMPVGLNRAVLTLHAGTVDLAELVPLPVPGAVPAEVIGGGLVLDGLRGSEPVAEGTLSAEVRGARLAGADLGGGPLQWQWRPDGGWEAVLDLSGGASAVTGRAEGDTGTSQVRYTATVADPDALPDPLRRLVAGAGRQTEGGTIVEGTFER